MTHNSNQLGPNTLADILRVGAASYRRDLAIIAGEQRLSYNDLLRFATKLARALANHGIKSGDRVGVLLPNGWEFVVAVFGCVLTEAIMVPLDPGIRPARFEKILADCSVTALVISEAAFSRLRTVIQARMVWQAIVLDRDERGSQQILSWSAPILYFQSILKAKDELPPATHKSVDSSAVVSISYTSGSTGEPKGVMHTHRSWLASAEFTANHLMVQAGEKILLPLPLHHAYSFRHILAYLLLGGTILISEDLIGGLAMARRERADAILLVPAACNLILQHFRTVIEGWKEFLKLISIGTASLPDSQYEELRAALPEVRIYLPYGLTEARVGFLRIGENGRRRTLTAIQPGMELRVVDENRRDVQTGETGEILLRGEGVMSGYWGDSSEDIERLHTTGFATGDLALLEEDGTVSLLGRVDGVIKIGGRKVAPSEVEDVLYRHPAISEAVVQGLPNPEAALGARLLAQVVLHPGVNLQASELIDFCRGELELYKVPEEIQFLESLERTAIGKVRRGGDRASEQE